jgi:hypothetical protein
VGVLLIVGLAKEPEVAKGITLLSSKGSDSKEEIINPLNKFIGTIILDTQTNNAFDNIYIYIKDYTYII